MALPGELGLRAHEFKVITERTLELCAALTEKQFNWRSHPKAWSAGQCIEHLNLVNRERLRNIRRAMNDARIKHRFGEGPFRHGLLGRLCVRLAEPPVKVKVKAPPKIAPAETLESGLVASEFHRQHEEIIECVAAACGLHLRKVKVASIANEWLRFSLGITFALMSAHDRRHLQQAQAVVAAMLSGTKTARP
jgi:hypothetical protein